jgi:hypothetical protein
MSVATAPLRRRLALVLVACLVAALGGLVTSSARAANSAPVAIVIDHITGETLTGLGALPPGAEPVTFVRAGQTFTVDVSFHDATGATVAFNNDTTIVITATTNNGAAVLTPSTVTVPKGNATFSLPTSISDAANQVVITVAIAGKKPSTVAPGVSYLPDATPVKDLRFDVVSDARTDSGGTDFQQGIGGDANCTNATKSAPVCAIVLLPRGAGANVLLSIGSCDTIPGSTYAPCFVGDKGAGGAVVQTLFAQPTTPYTTTSPATIVVKCDKTLCGTGPIHGLTVAYSLLGNGALADALPCPAKNTMATAGVPCVDYVQSKRDGSGDTHLFLLTDQDLRGGIG